MAKQQHAILSCLAWRWLTLAVVTLWMDVSDAKRFSITGPVLTVTLKDPLGESSIMEEPKKWGVNVSSLRPTMLWSAQSTQGLPLPNWLPALKSLRGTMGYRYDDLKQLPSFLEGDAVFGNDKGELHLQPTYEVGQRKASVVVQASRGASYALARFTSKGKRVRCCYCWCYCYYCRIGSVSCN